MGFFSDLKDDLSQAVNELMPEEGAEEMARNEMAAGTAPAREPELDFGADISQMLDSLEAAQEPEPEPESAPEPANPADELTYVNVIQSLVEELAPRYIKMFGLCSCPRCRIDVVALTLNNLIPKYVVMKKHDMIPMLTVYEGRFSSTIFAQLTRACKAVMDSPRHDREQSLL